VAIDKGGWSWGPHSRRWHNIGVGGILLFFIRVTDDDDLVVAKRPKKTVAEVTEEPPRKILILRGVKEDIFLI
jgi:hypothetical protein